MLGGKLNDLWRFNAESCRLVKLQPRGKRPRATESFGALVGDRLVLCQGLLRPGPLMKDDLSVLDLRPTLKTLCKVQVVDSGLDCSKLSKDLRRELSTMTTKQERRRCC